MIYRNPREVSIVCSCCRLLHLRCARSYRLEIVQHPVQTCEFGSYPLTRLPLLPPLIAQLYPLGDTDGDVTEDSELPFLIAQLTLFTGDGTMSLDVASASGEQSLPKRLLYGSLVSSTHVLWNLRGKQGVYFLFPDVSIRWRGRYQLGVTLIRLNGQDSPSTTGMSKHGTVIARARSLPFDVLLRAGYIAPAQTPFTEYFLQQGAQMYAIVSHVMPPAC
ncbi:velvet factor [Amylocystis lapponica]|nr:velvet factor [Amylocystis lapponica]